jgi:hypothetical protein
MPERRHLFSRYGQVPHPRRKLGRIHDDDLPATDSCTSMRRRRRSWNDPAEPYIQMRSPCVPTTSTAIKRETRHLSSHHSSTRNKRPSRSIRSRAQIGREVSRRCRTDRSKDGRARSGVRRRSTTASVRMLTCLFMQVEIVIRVHVHSNSQNHNYLCALHHMYSVVNTGAYRPRHEHMCGCTTTTPVFHVATIVVVPDASDTPRYAGRSVSGARRDPLLASLAAELDNAMDSVRSARKLIDEIQRAGINVGTRAALPLGAEPELTGAAPSLRHAGMTVPEAAAVLGITEEHVRRLLRRRDLFGVPFGGRIGWRLSHAYVAEVAAYWAATREAKVAVRESKTPRPASVPKAPRKSPRKSLS